jgi:hypothetical protein
MAGHWAIPPQPGYVWEPAEWQNVNGQWTFYDGHWRTADVVDPQMAYQPPPPPVQQVVVEAAPPAPIVEVRPAIPFDGAIWVPGYWHWNGNRHIWVSGRWSARPAGYRWEENGWSRRDDGRWERHPGHWHPDEDGDHDHDHDRDHDHGRGHGYGHEHGHDRDER